MMSKELLLIYSQLHRNRNRQTLMTTIFKFSRKRTMCVGLVDVCNAINTILDEQRFLITITS